MGAETMESHVSALEGAYKQVADRLNGMDARIGSIELRIDTFSRDIDQRFNWLTGIVVATWITTMLAILFHPK